MAVGVRAAISGALAGIRRTVRPAVVTVGVRAAVKKTARGFKYYRIRALFF